MTNSFPIARKKSNRIQGSTHTFTSTLANSSGVIRNKTHCNSHTPDTRTSQDRRWNAWLAGKPANDTNFCSHHRKRRNRLIFLTHGVDIGLSNWPLWQQADHSENVSKPLQTHHELCWKSSYFDRLRQSEEISAKDIQWSFLIFGFANILLQY